MYEFSGNLPLNSPTYVEREADENLYKALISGKFCYVLSPRQTGKSSLKVRTMQRLETEGFDCIDIDLNMIGKDITIDQWYATVIDCLATRINPPDFNVTSWCNLYREQSAVYRLRKFIEEKLVPHPNKIVIFVDEIDSVLSNSLKGKLDDFFALIRSCSNQGASQPEFKRITFVLLGVATISELIADPKITSFNIGTAIELKRFHLDEARPLLQGLEGRVSNPQAVLQEVLAWTGGQPFLTQKLCALITDGMEASGVEQLVKQQIVQNWESQDNPEHLRTIHARIVPGGIGHILSRLQSVDRLLRLYEQILDNDEIPADDSYEQQELLLSGLVVKQDSKLRIYNPIYRIIFNFQWLKQQLRSVESQISNQLQNQRPYQHEITQWLANNRPESKLLRGQKLTKAREWYEGKTLSPEDNDFIMKSIELKEREIQGQLISTIRQSQGHLISTICVSLVGLVLVVGGSNWHIKDVNDKLSSGGERTLFKGIENSNRDKGIEAFKKHKYEEAYRFFKKARIADRKDPEVEIYFNNAKALKEQKSGNKEKKELVTLAVVVPLDSKDEIAQEILRGVAQAQYKFNDKKQNRFLKILIAKDGNDPKKAEEVAKKLIKNQDIMGVIGHNTSTVTEAALPQYQTGELAIISPTTTSTSPTLTSAQPESRVFFRTVPNDTETAKKLAIYAKKYTKVGICNNPNNTYSDSLTKAFTDSFEKDGRQVVGEPIDLTYPALDASGVVATMLNNQANASVLLPDTETISVAIEIASAQEKLSQSGTKKLQLLGADALYNPKIFDGGEAVEGLVLAVPWFRDQKNSKTFAAEAKERWKGNVSWRTATSYDATQALIKALPVAQKPSRDAVLKNLKSINLTANETSGSPLSFVNGEREGQKPVLVKVFKGSNGLDFKLENE
ncbi:ABC transporter substrate-binding protein [Microcoleus sp. T2B6]|uniref:ABC transporter substrate-binding protein n=1 Tax=Microcoleus sp. T2B6 TaxID=3055424 RepID=UPI002FD0FB08